MENTLINELIDYLKVSQSDLTFKYLKDNNVVETVIDSDRIEIRGRGKNTNRYFTIVITSNVIIFYKSFSWDTVAAKRELIYELKDSPVLDTIKKDIKENNYFD